MINPIVIIGSGFAAYQLVKTLRRQNAQQAITVITADNGADYSKPDLSHVFTKKQTATDLVKMSGKEFAIEYGITLLSNQRVESINIEDKNLLCNGTTIAYDKLVLATGASAFVPPMNGNAIDQIITLNSLSEYEQAQEKLAVSTSVLVIGAGLIGTEIAMDLSSSGKQVILVDQATSLLSSLLPEFISAQLYQSLGNVNVNIELDTKVSSLDNAKTGQAIQVTLANGRIYQVDSVISAVGLKPNTQVASAAGINNNRGIVVDSQLCTSAKDVYALGDCAEIDGQVLPFLQPILLSANALAKTLLGQPTEVKFPAMLVKVKTPLLPIQLSGKTCQADANWQIDATPEGMTAKAFNASKQLIGFVVTQAHMKQAFGLLRQLPAVI